MSPRTGRLPWTSLAWADGTILCLSVPSRAWYAPTVPDDRDAISVLRQFPPGIDQGCVWEFTITHDHLGARLDLYDDAWRAFNDAPSLFTNLTALTTQRRRLTLDDTLAWLLAVGITDATPYTRPGARP